MMPRPFRFFETAGLFPVVCAVQPGACPRGAGPRHFSGATMPPVGPWIIVAQDAYIAGPVVMDAWDADEQIVQDDYSSGAEEQD